MKKRLINIVLFLFLVINVSFGQFIHQSKRAEETGGTMLSLKMDKMARSDKQWFKIVTDISCHHQYPELQKACSRILFGKEYADALLDDALNQYLSNTYDEVILPDGYDRTKGQEERMKVNFVSGETGKYLNYNVEYLKIWNEGKESYEKKRERHFVYDVTLAKALTMDDIFLPAKAEAIKKKLNLGKKVPQLEVSESAVTVGYIKDSEFTGFSLKYIEQNDSAFTNEFKQLIGFEALKESKQKADSLQVALARQRNLRFAREQRQRDSLQTLEKKRDLQNHSVRFGKDNHQVLCIYEYPEVSDLNWLNDITLIAADYDEEAGYTRIDYLDNIGSEHTFYTKGNVTKKYLTTANKDIFRYAEDAYKDRIEGTVIISTIVRKDGTKTDKKVLKSLYPSLDEDALSRIDKLSIPVSTLFGQEVSKRCQVAFTYTIYDKDLFDYELLRENKELGKKIGECFIDNNFPTDKGILTRLTMGRKLIKYGGYRSGEKHSTADLDIPANQMFENLLCKEIFKKSGKSLKKLFLKESKDAFGKIGLKNVNIKGSCLSYAPDKYYSYGYTDIYSDKVHNVVYGIKEQRLLTVNDLLTAEEIAKAGISQNATIGMDSLFVYIERKEASPFVYALNKQNWDKFAPVLQNMLGNDRDALPQFTADDYSLRHYWGVQPHDVSLRLVKRAGYASGFDSMKDQLASRLHVSDSLSRDYSSNISFLVDENGQVSNISAKTFSGSELMTENLSKAIKEMDMWQPLQLSNGKQSALLSYRFMGAVSKDGAFPGDELLRLRRGSHSLAVESLSTENEGKVYEVVGQMPEFPGGSGALMAWIDQNLHYPSIAEENGIQGRVVCTFVVERDGSITNVKVSRSIDPSLDKEAVRVLKKMPKWNPGRLADGVAVRVRYTVPVTFKLN